MRRQRHLPAPAAPSNDTVDNAFRGFGAATCDADGKFSFATIAPVPYTGRPPYVHTKVWVGGDEKLTTRIYRQGFRGPGKRKIAPVESDQGYVAHFGFVVG